MSPMTDAIRPPLAPAPAGAGASAAVPAGRMVPPIICNVR